MAFISTTNLVAGQNSDGNAEVFRIALSGDSLEQVTKPPAGRAVPRAFPPAGTPSRS